MSRPPQHIRIKRRREDEPVETLYIQSDTPQNKRRFTDYVFQRVVRSHDAASLPGATDPATQSPPKKLRAVSTSQSPGVERSSTGVPIVKTPASIKKPREKLAPIEVNEQPKRATGDEKAAISDSSPLPSPSSIPKALLPSKRASGSGFLHRAASVSSLRRFHISASTGSDEEDPSRVLHRVRGGIQKKKGTKSISGRPVIVEKLPGKAVAAKGASILSNVTPPATSHGIAHDSGVTEHRGGVLTEAPRKRRVVSQAEKKWQAHEKGHRYPDRTQPSWGQLKNSKKGESARDDPNTWDLDSETLADELSQIALDMTHPAETAEPVSVAKETETPTQPKVPTHQPLDTPVLKHQPRQPKKPHKDRRNSKATKDGGADIREPEGMDIERAVSGPGVEEVKALQSQPKVTPEAEKDPIPTQSSDRPFVSEMDTSDEGYVYDEFIRHSIQDMNDDSRIAHIRNGQWHGGHGEVPKDIGVVVITDEDVQYWDAFAEDDDEDKDWDTEDGDSNAEDHPANEYPDEDLDFDDEENNMTAIYQRFRSNASDDEEYDINEYDEYGYRAYNRNGDFDDYDTDD